MAADTAWSLLAIHTAGRWDVEPVGRCLWCGQGQVNMRLTHTVEYYTFSLSGALRWLSLLLSPGTSRSFHSDSVPFLLRSTFLPRVLPRPLPTPPLRLVRVECNRGGRLDLLWLRGAAVSSSVLAQLPAFSWLVSDADSVSWRGSPPSVPCACGTGSKSTVPTWPDEDG